jgi:hypothetical protein
MANKPRPAAQRLETVTTTINLRAIKWIATACRGNWWPFSDRGGIFPRHLLDPHQSPGNAGRTLRCNGARSRRRRVTIGAVRSIHGGH